MSLKIKKLSKISVKDIKIKYQLMVYSTISFIVVLLGFVFLIENIYGQITLDVKKEAQMRLMTTIEQDIRYKIINYDYLGVEESIDKALAQSEIDMMIVSYSASLAPGDTGVIAKRFNKSTKLIENVPAEILNDNKLDKTFYSYSHLVDANGNIFGKVEVYFNKTNIQYVIQISKILIISLIITSFCVLLYIVVKILDIVLVSRLNKLQYALNSVLGRDTGIFLEIAEEDELGEIKKTINSIHANMLTMLNEKNGSHAKLELQIREIELLQKQIIQAEKIAGLGAIVGGVAHELNSPLSSVNVITETIKENIDIFKQHLSKKNATSSDVAMFIENIEEGLNILYAANTKALKLIEEFKSAVSSQTDEQIVKINVKRFLEELMHLMKTTYPVTNINIIIDVDADIPKIETMRGCLFRVMTGLVSNVYVHAFPNSAKGTMRIKVKNIDEQYLEISVIDTGIGIKEEHLDKVFDPFFTTSLNHKNQGLGLHLALTETIKNLKGTLTAAGAENKGATFTLIIPKKIVKPKP